MAVQATGDNAISPGSNADLAKDGVSILLTQRCSRLAFCCKRSLVAFAFRIQIWNLYFFNDDMACVLLSSTLLNAITTFAEIDS